MDNIINIKTEIMPNQYNLKTEILPENLNRITEVMPSEKISFVTNITEGILLKGQYDNYKTTGLMNDKSGEADIWLVESTSGKKLVAKVFKSDITNTYREEIIKFLLSNKDKNFVELIDYGIYEDRQFDIIPLYLNGDLSNKKVSKSFLKKIIPQINETLKVMHENGFVHRDIKPSNFFLSDDMQTVYLADFGIVTQMAKNLSLAVTNAKFTRGYAAPETYLLEPFFTRKTDYYALGITIASLYIGKEIFADYPENIIHQYTVRGDLPYPKMDLDIENLVKALTRAAEKDRASYEDVKKWCNGEILFVADNKNNFGKVYTINNFSCHNKKEIIEQIVLNWDEAIKHLYRGSFAEFFKNDQNLYNEIIDLTEIEPTKSNKNAGVFRFIYLIKPKFPPIWKGKIYKSFEELIIAIKNSIDNNKTEFYEFFSTNCLSFFYNLKNENKNKILLLTSIEKRAINNPRVAIKSYLYRVNPEFFSINILDQTIKSYNELLEYIKFNFDNIKNYAEELYQNEDFFAYLESMGYEELIASMPDKKNLSKSEIKFNLLLLLDVIIDDKEVKEEFINSICNQKLIWLHNNYKNYDCYGNLATNNFFDIEEIEFNNEMTFTEKLFVFEKLEKIYEIFLRYSCNCPCLIKTKAFCITENYIYPLDKNYLFVKYNKEYYPYGFINEKVISKTFPLKNTNVNFIKDSINKSLSIVTNFLQDIQIDLNISKGNINLSFILIWTIQFFITTFIFINSFSGLELTNFNYLNVLSVSGLMLSFVSSIILFYNLIKELSIFKFINELKELIKLKKNLEELSNNVDFDYDYLSFDFKAVPKKIIQIINDDNKEYFKTSKIAKCVQISPFIVVLLLFFSILSFQFKNFENSSSIIGKSTLLVNNISLELRKNFKESLKAQKEEYDIASLAEYVINSRYKTLDLREFPDVNSKLLATIAANNQKIKATGKKEGDWIEVEVDGYKGFAKKSFLRETYK